MDVHFTVRDGAAETVEVHPMRYLFPEETRTLLAEAGLALVELCPFMRRGAPLTDRDWLFSAVARVGEEA